MDRILQFWNGRNAREKAALGAGAVVLLLAIAYLLLIEPARGGGAGGGWGGAGWRLERGLPALRAQVAQLESLLAEVKTLKSRPQVATTSPSEARGALEKSLAAAGLKAARIVPLSDGDLQLTFADVPYAGWAVWLAGIERELGARAINVTASGNNTPGRVDVELALRLARR
jgi:general secretion pathway protein M